MPNSPRSSARLVLVLALVALGLSACATSDDRGDSTTRPTVPAAQAIRELADAWWELQLKHQPEMATLVGDHRYDHLLSETGPEARARQLTEVEAFRARVSKLRQDLAAQTIGARDAITLDMLETAVNEHIEAEQLGLATVAFNQMSGPQASFGYFVNAQHPMGTVDDVENLLKRYAAFPAHMDGLIADVRAGLAKGRAVPKVIASRVSGQLDAFCADPASPANPFSAAAERVPTSLDAAARDALMARVRAAGVNDVVATLCRFRDFWAAEVVPTARDTVGIGAVPGGADIYASRARHHTTTALSPDEIHALGLKELERIEGELRKLGAERGHNGDGWSFVKVLLEDKGQYAASREALLETFKVALKRADAALPTVFGRLPKLPYEVKPMDAQREKNAPAAYYEPGAPKDGRPGVFVANLHRFEERPAFNSPVLAFHEAVPGHHLQIAIAQEIEGLPRFRAEAYVTAYVEGWALYSERLSDELALYPTLEAKVGYLGFAAWRASRLVVDTGIHAKGWTRQHAMDFLAAHTTLGPIDVENEIDRYIAWPGQALAYMVGCLHILGLREALSEELGPRFDLRAFHDAVLGEGPMPLATLTTHVRRALGARAE